MSCGPVFACAALLWTATAYAESVIPIEAQSVPGAPPRFTVSVRVGDGAPFDALLVTAETGLRALARVIDPTQVVVTGAPRGFMVGSGIVADGPLVAGTISLGSARSAAPLNFQLIRRVECTAYLPRCPAFRQSADDFGFGGRGRSGFGFPAMLGIWPSGPDQPNRVGQPLRALGARRWIVELGRGGRIVLDPTDAEAAGFVPLALRHGPRAPATPLDLYVPACPERPAAQQPLCGQLSLDATASPEASLFTHYDVLFDADAGTIAVKHKIRD